MLSILLHADMLVDRSTLVVRLPAAWAAVLAEEEGGKLDVWKMAYHNVVGDWASYWDDLDLNQDDSLAQWREGRWRIVRALFRLARREAPSSGRMAYYLDELQVQIGMKAPAWQPGAIQALRDLTVSGYSVGIVDPFTSAYLLRGMLIPFALDTRVHVFGPDELEQVGLDGILWETLVRITGGHPQQTKFVSPHPMYKASVIQPPTDLSTLPTLLAEHA